MWPINPYPIANDCGPHHEWSLTYCIVCQKVHPMPSTCVSDRTTNNKSRTPNDRLILNLTRKFVTYSKNIHRMTISVDLYPLHSLPIYTPYPMPLGNISTAIYLFYHTSWLGESSRVRSRVLLIIYLHWANPCWLTFISWLLMFSWLEESSRVRSRVLLIIYLHWGSPCCLTPFFLAWKSNV
jgi:hypothetical protein